MGANTQQLMTFLALTRHSFWWSGIYGVRLVASLLPPPKARKHRNKEAAVGKPSPLLNIKETEKSGNLLPPELTSH